MLLNYVLKNTRNFVYKLKCINNSNSSCFFYIFQRMVNQPNNIFSLAWLVSPCKISKNDWVKFQWSSDYSFIWAHTGLLTADKTYDAGGSCACSPTGNNLTTFELLDNVPTLSNPTTGGTDGSFTIQEGSSFPNNTYSTGIGMSGQGILAKQALVNTKQIYSSEYQYYIATSDEEIEAGYILEQSITCSPEIIYSNNIYDLTISLNIDNTWSIS